MFKTPSEIQKLVLRDGLRKIDIFLEQNDAPKDLKETLEVMYRNVAWMKTGHERKR